MLCCCCLTAPGWAATKADDESALRACIEQYRQSIINADDENLAEAVWQATPDVSFIHPRGHEHGWDQVKADLYGKTMDKNFSSSFGLAVSGREVTVTY